MFLIARLSLISTLVSLSSALIHNAKLGAIQLENVRRGESSPEKSLRTCKLHPLGLGKDDTDQVCLIRNLNGDNSYAFNRFRLPFPSVVILEP